MLKRFFNINNKAFTLIEILLALSLLIVATIGIGSVIISTQNNTAHMLSESELQQQLVEIQESLHNEILMTNAGIKYWTRNDAYSQFAIADQDFGVEYEQLIAFYMLDSVDYTLTKTYYLYNSEENTNSNLSSLSYTINVLCGETVKS